LLAITAKLSGFRGESRFTTWAHRLVVLEVSAKQGRHFWPRPSAAMDVADSERRADRFGVAPDDHGQRRDLIDGVRPAVTARLTAHQRQVFVALVVDDVPLDALMTRTVAIRNAIHKTMFDARCAERVTLNTPPKDVHLVVSVMPGPHFGSPEKRRVEVTCTA
jgi:RNA polymerase sigma-70 factor, ECF subfamily